MGFGCSGRNCSKNLTGSTTGPTTTLGEECVGHGLRACATKRSWGFVAAADPGLPPKASNNRILALPGSDSRSADAALVDGDLETVWRSKPGSDSLKLVVDLGPQDIVVKKLRIHWAGRAAAAEYRISASGMDPSACDADLEELVAWTTSSMAPFHRTGTALALTVATWRITGHPWFVVDWKSAEGNILFRFNPNSADQQIIMNSYLVQNEDGKDKWHTENRVSYTGTSEQTWTVTVDEIGFHVLSGAQEVFVYAHRLPWSSFEKIETQDNVNVVYNEVKVADQVEEIDTGAFLFTPRVFMIELRGLRADVPSFGIRSLVFVDELALPYPSMQQLLLQVGGASAVCAAGNLSLCSFKYVPMPEVLRVSPSDGTAGSVITVNATGLNLDDCAANAVTIASNECVVQSCGRTNTNTSANADVLAELGWVRCSVVRSLAGTYRVELTVDGVAARSSETFTYPLSITGVTPAAGSYGGGYTLTVTGDGFSTNAARIKATFCDSPCRVTKANLTSLECVAGAIFDSAHMPGHETMDIPVADGGDDATEDVMSGAIVVSGGVLAPYLMPHGYEWSRRAIYLRFSSVDIAQGLRVARARLQVHAADAQCEKGSHIRIFAESSDDSVPFWASESGSLGARPRSGVYHDWFVQERWRWMAEAQESSDISHLLNEVLARSGWRAGNAITLILQQRTDFAGSGLPEKSCNVLSADYSGKYAPKLRLKLANFTTPSALVAERACVLSVTVDRATDVQGTSECNAARVSMIAVASSSDAPARPSLQADLGNGYEDPNLYRQWMHKKRSTLTYEEARTTCASIGSRLCRKDKELLVPGVGGALQPFFPQPTVNAVNSDFPLMVPFERQWWGVEASHQNNWLQVSGDDVGAEAWYPDWNNFHVHSDSQYNENEQRTSVVPCCGVTGHPAYMAVDDSTDSFWDSGITGTANLTLTVVSGNAASLQSIDILWTDDYAREYSVHASANGSPWFQVAQNRFGDGSVDTLRLGHGRCDGISALCLCDATRDAAACNWTSPLVSTQHLQLKIHMLSPALGGARYGIRDVAVRGCGQATSAALAADVASLFTARLALTPEVASVVPERGTTAGGSDVTVAGRFFSTDASKISVSLGPFACKVKSITSLSDDQQRIVCLSSASGILHGGRKFVTVSIDGHGTTLASETATFWYVDTWSARTTWGGSAPPTGCGSYAEDKLCTDTVHIPAGQVVLLDQSLPRFYLLLIEGSLIFERRDISLSANYILLRGGTLQIGTESQPFTQNVQITLFGNPKSADLPTFGSKVIACYECKMDIHGEPQVAWTTLAATVMPGATEITVRDPVAWPVDSKIVIATTDFESPRSSHSEVATVAAVLNGGTLVQLKDIRVCPEYGFSGLPEKCTHSENITFPHLGETAVFDGKRIPFRAEVSLLSRNIVIQGDHDESLCPMADTADDGVTRLSCNQFGGQMFFHSPGTFRFGSV